MKNMIEVKKKLKYYWIDMDRNGMAFEKIKLKKDVSDVWN